MDFNAWLTANGFDPATLSDSGKSKLQAQWRAEQNPTPPAPAVSAPPASESKPSDASFEQKLAAIDAENDRIDYIRKSTLAAMERHKGNLELTQQLRTLCDSAVADSKVDKRAFDLALLRADRFAGPHVFATSQPQVDDKVIEAAICSTYKLANVEKSFDDRTLQTAHTRFRRGIGLQEMLMLAAERNGGYRGSSRDVTALCRAAFRPANADSYGSPMMTGPSTIAVPGILGNTANKFLANGFLYTEQAWRQIAKIRPASDYKTMTTYRLTGANKFEKVAANGEIKHGTLSELSYTNQVDIWGKLLGIGEKEIRNDDLGAFTSASDELGRGAGDALNETFWTTWLDDSAFFPTDKSYANYDDGATDSVLSLAGLENANAIFATQTKPDGTPMGIMPRILLVPFALWATAKNLMSGMVTAAAQSTATVTTENIWRGMFDVVPSVYLQSSAITGYSATAWYLLADPNNVAAIEVAFLDGIEAPQVETGEFDFERLGLAMRATMRWGCRKQEYRAGVKLKGAA